MLDCVPTTPSERRLLQKCLDSILSADEKRRPPAIPYLGCRRVRRILESPVDVPQSLRQQLGKRGTLLRQQSEKFIVLLHGLSDMRHELRSNGVLCRLNIANVVLGSLFKNVRCCLPVVLSQLLDFLVENCRHVESDLCCCWHKTSY